MFAIVYTKSENKLYCRNFYFKGVENLTAWQISYQNRVYHDNQQGSKQKIKRVALYIHQHLFFRMASSMWHSADPLHLTVTLEL